MGPYGSAKTERPTSSNNPSAQQLSDTSVIQAPPMNKRGPATAGVCSQDRGNTATKYQINQLRQFGLVKVSVAKNQEGVQPQTKNQRQAPQQVILRGDTSQVRMLMKNWDPKQFNQQVQTVRVAVLSKSGQLSSVSDGRTPQSARQPQWINSNPRPLLILPQTGNYTSPGVPSMIPHGTPRLPQGITSSPTATVHHGPSAPRVPVGQPARNPLVPGLCVGGLGQGPVYEQSGGGRSKAVFQSGGGESQTGHQPEGGGSQARYQSKGGASQAGYQSKGGASQAGYRVQWVTDGK